MSKREKQPMKGKTMPKQAPTPPSPFCGKSRTKEAADHTQKMARLKRRKLDHWSVLISAIDKSDVRAKVANVVWWDWFSQRLDTPSALASQRAAYRYTQSENEDEVIAALRQLGYPARLAVSRGRRPR